jgi:hypothetical protein
MMLSCSSWRGHRVSRVKTGRRRRRRGEGDGRNGEISWNGESLVQGQTKWQTGRSVVGDGNGRRKRKGGEGRVRAGLWERAGDRGGIKLRIFIFILYYYYMIL